MNRDERSLRWWEIFGDEWRSRQMPGFLHADEHDPNLMWAEVRPHRDALGIYVEEEMAQCVYSLHPEPPTMLAPMAGYLGQHRASIERAFGGSLNWVPGVVSFGIETPALGTGWASPVIEWNELVDALVDQYAALRDALAVPICLPEPVRAYSVTKWPVQ
ncbi:MAG TPA: hypothetical protein PLS15_02255 [Fimbriimonadaceae bacterium]|nr:hypothetical protein [Fimbriimonadaceae bacterium]HRE92844.1 hypothetical protein [Fimbriimonadaceae bacterium]